VKNVQVTATCCFNPHLQFTVSEQVYRPVWIKTIYKPLPLARDY